MKFSVVVPTYNRKTDLQECLNAILKQKSLPSELIVIDDGELPENFIKRNKIYFKEKDIDFVYYKKDKAQKIFKKSFKAKFNVKGFVLYISTFLGVRFIKFLFKVNDFIKRKVFN